MLHYVALLCNILAQLRTIANRNEKKRQLLPVVVGHRTRVSAEIKRTYTRISFIWRGFDAMANPALFVLSYQSVKYALLISVLGGKPQTL